MRRKRRGDPSTALRAGKSRVREAKRPPDSFRPSAAEASALRLLGPRLITTVWLVFVVAMYLGFQIERLLRLFAAHR
jgi:hypothetical protein